MIRDLDAEKTRRLVLREANLSDLRSGLVAGDLDVILVPSVEAMPLYERRIVDSEPLVWIERAPATSTPANVGDLAHAQFILMPDTCGLTTFTRALLHERALPFRTYPGEATSYQVLEEWSRLGLGSAMLPASKVSAIDAPARHVLEDDGSTVEIFYEAIWSPRSLLAPDLKRMVDTLTNAST